MNASPSSQSDGAVVKINGQDMPPQEIQAKESINTDARRQCVTENEKRCALLAQSHYFVQWNVRHKLDTASGGNLKMGGR